MKNKKPLILLVFVLAMIMTFSGVILSGCGDKYANMKIEIKGDSEIVLYTDPENESQSKTASIQVKVSGVSESVSKGVMVTVENPDCVAYTINEPDSEGVNEVILTARRGGTTKVTIVTVEGNKSTVISIRVIQQIKSVAVYANFDMTVYTNSATVLDPINILSFTPNTTSQKDVLFELKEAYEGIEIIKANGVSTLTVGEKSSTQIITVKATVVEDGHPIEGIDTVEFPVKVIEPLSIETVTIQNLTTSENLTYRNGSYEVIELTCNLPITSKYCTNSLQIVVQPKNPTSEKFVVEDEFAISMDSTVAELSRTSDIDSFIYDVTGVNSGDTLIQFVVTIDGFSGYEYVVEVPVHVITLPEFVSVNGNTTDFNGTLFTVYEAKGLEFEVSIGPSNAYDFRYEVRCDNSVVNLMDSNGAPISLMDIEGEAYKKTNPRIARPADKIYAVAKADAADRNTSSSIQFIAYASLEMSEYIVVTTYNFSVSQGVKAIDVEQFENNTIYVEKDGTATFEYTLSPQTDNEKEVDYDDSFITAQIMTAGGDEFISVEKSATEQGQFVIRGLKNTERVAVAVTSANGVTSKQLYVSVFTPGTFVAVSIPPASTNSNIIQTNYINLAYGDENQSRIKSLSQPYSSINYDSGLPVVELDDDESIDSPVFGAIVAKNTSLKFTLTNDPSNKNQTIVGVSYKFLIPEQVGNKINFREFNGSVDKVKGTITQAGDLRVIGDGTIYIMVTVKFYAGAEENGQVKEVYYNRLIAISSYPTITSVTLQTLTSDVVYNKDGLGDIDVMTSDLKTFNYTKLTIGPESATSKEILRSENTSLTWELYGLPTGVELIKTYKTTDFVEFNDNAELSVKDIHGVALVFDTDMGAYPFADVDDSIYTCAYLFFNFDDSAFGQTSSMMLTLSAQLTQFNKSEVKEVSIIVKRPVKATGIDLGQSVKNVATQQSQLLTSVPPMTYELYIDSREGVNDLEDVKNLTEKNPNLTNSWQIQATMKPSNVTNGKLNYVLCDATGEVMETSDVVKILNDGTVIPLSAGLQYVKLIPMSGELANTFIIRIRVANGEGWDTAYKIYNQTDLLNIAGNASTRYDTLSKFYELANDIYLDRTFAPIGVYSNEVVAFSGGLRGYNEGIKSNYAIYNFEMVPYTTTISGTKVTYAGLFGVISGEVSNLEINVRKADVQVTEFGDTYIGALSGRVAGLGKIYGVRVNYESCNIYSITKTYFGGITGFNEGIITDFTRTYTYESELTETFIFRPRVTGELNVEVNTTAYVGGIAGENSVNGIITSDFDYFTENINFNNANDNIDAVINVNITSGVYEGSVGGVAGVNKNEISKISSVAIIDANAENVGGIAGLTYGNINECYFVGTVKNGKNAGGIAGKLDILSQNGGRARTVTINRSITEILDTTISTTTLINGSRIQGKENVGGIVGYADFSTDKSIYDAGHNTIESCYVRSYLPQNNYSDIALQSLTGNLGGIVGYGKNLFIKTSYSILNINIEKSIGNLNVGGIAGKLENVVFDAQVQGNSVKLSSNIYIEDCFATGNIIVASADEFTQGNIGQLAGHVDLDEDNLTVGTVAITNRVYTAMASVVDYNSRLEFGLFGLVDNVISSAYDTMFVESYYLYTLDGDVPYFYGIPASLFELQDASVTFANWENYRTTWQVLTGSNNDLMILYIVNNGELVPYFTITPTSITLNIKQYTPEDEDQLFTRVDSSSTSIGDNSTDAISKSAVLYIFNDDIHTNVYSINDIVKIATIPLKVNNSRYIVVSNDSSIVRVQGDKFIVVGEGTCIITICSAYNKESVYDSIQLAVVYHNFAMTFLDENLKEYTDADVIMISKNGSEQLVVFVDTDSSVDGLKFTGNLKTTNEQAITINGALVGDNIDLIRNNNSTYNNVVSVTENGVYEETTALTFTAIPYFKVNLYTNPSAYTEETLMTRTIYNNLDFKTINVLIYVGATEITFNTNNVSSAIGNEINVNVTLHTDYEPDTLLMFFEGNLVMTDDNSDFDISNDDFTIHYNANTKVVQKYYDSFEEKDVFSGLITYQFSINASDKYLNTLDPDMKILYTAIESSITFAGRSSYINPNISTSIEDYSVVNTFNFKITPAIVSTINITNFAAGRTVSGKYVPEDPSFSIVPGEVGLVDIQITPAYAGVKKITIENAYSNYTKISLLQVLREYDTGLYVQDNSIILNTENGVQLMSKSDMLADGSMIFDGHYYVRTLIQSKVPMGIELSLIVTTVFEEDGKETTKVESITLITSESAGVHMDFDGENYAYIVKGTSLTPRTKVVGFTNAVTYSLSNIEHNLENFYYYFDSTFTDMINIELMTDEQRERFLDVDLDILFNDQIRVDSSTGEIYVGVLIKKGVTLTIEASVIEYMNNGGKLGSDSINVYVVDYLIEGVKVQNAVNGTLTAVCNIPKTLKVEFDVNRCDFFDYKYDYLEDVLSTSIYRNVAKATELFFGKNTEFKSAIDTEIENLLREINTYEVGVWMYSSDSITANERNYITINVGETYDRLFEVQTASYEANSNLTCYALRVKEICTITLKANVKLTFAFSSVTNSVTYTFNPLSDPEIVGDLLDFNYEFNISSVDSSSQDNPLPIYDQEKFIEYIFGTEDTHFILLTDIVLDEWTAQDTNIASLDGNGYTITINSFAQSTEDSAYFGLFKSISEKTILTNIQVCLPNDMELRTSANAGEVNVGLFAYENNGTLFNCAVTPTGDINIDVVTDATIVNNSLFVNINRGSISNSRVGYIDGTSVNQYALHFNSFNNIAGFVVSNYGHIASCFVKDISLTCKDLNALHIDNTGVAGFAITNMSTGKIYFSYAEGIRGEDTENTQIQLSEKGYKEYNTGIFSPGVVAGFVYTNNGYIQDTYANIPLITPTSSTGFVFKNSATGTILNAFSTCLQPTTLDNGKEEYANTSRSQFTGINDLNEVQNSGTITYAYYYNSGFDSNIYAGLGEPALALPVDSFKDSLEEFGNFVGGENMIWVADPLHPQLVSPNRIIKSQRYLVNNLDGTETDEELDSYIYYYEYVVDGEFSDTGTYNNPIVISSGAKLVEMSSQDRVVPYTNSSTNETIFTSLNMNDYIVIKDIDVSTVIDTGLENLQSITYAGMFEGNGFTLQNVSVLSEKSSRLNGVSFGLFEQIGAYILFQDDVLVTVDSTNYHAQMKNITFEINAISGTHATAVGTLAGIIVNADILNINLVSNAKDNEVVTVQGERYVGAVAGYIAGNSTITNITSNISVTADYRNEGTIIENIKPFTMGNNAILNSIYSYKFNINTDTYTGGFAGGIAGLVDMFTTKITKNAEGVSTSLSRYDFDKTGYNYVALNFAPQISTVKVYDSVSIIGDVAGGIVGLNYSGTHIYNARIILELGEEQKISGELITGGLIGMNYGKIDQSCMSHEDEVQTGIDDLSTEKTEISQALFYEESKFPIYVGGLVGYNVGTNNHSGVITNCYSRANVINHNAKYVGGMVGYMNNGYLQYCYVSGNVIGSQKKEDPDTGTIKGEDGIAAGAVAHIVAFTSKNSIKYFTEYTGLSYYSMWSLVVANDWDENVNIATTAALIGKSGSGVRLEDGIINGDMDIFVNNMNQKLYDVLDCGTVGGNYNIVNIIEGMDGNISKYRLIASYEYEVFKAYYLEGAEPDENVLYQTWDRNIWDLSQPYFPKLLLNTNGDQNYITNEEELRAMGTDGFYIIQNDIYLTKDWIPKEGFEGTLTSKKKKDGTYCTVYNININSECYNVKDENGNTTLENIGNVGFFSSVKDKAYIYNVNFVFGGNIMLPEDYDMENDAPVHIQRNQWENYDHVVAYTPDSGIINALDENGHRITYDEVFVNGIRNNLDYATVISNNVADLEDGLFINSYGTGALAGVATNATFSNITISYGAYTYYDSNGKNGVTKKSSIDSNTPYIGGFIGYASNCKLTNCQVTDNPIPTYVKNRLGENVHIEGDAVINVYNNGYINDLTTDRIKSIVNNYTDLLTIANVILEFYQQPQCVGGFIGKLDSASNFIKFNGRTVTSHINVYELYENGDSYSLASPYLNIGGLMGYCYTASLDTVNVTGTIVSSMNTTGINVTHITGMTEDQNTTEQNIGGVIGVSDKGMYSYCVYQGTIKMIDSSQSTTPPRCESDSVLNIGGVIGKLKGDVTMNYCICKGFNNPETSAYKDFKDPIVFDTTDHIKYVSVGGVLGNATTLSPKIKKSMFNGDMILGGTVDVMMVGGVLGDLMSSNLLTNKATIQNTYTLGTIYERATINEQIVIGGVVGRSHKISASSVASTMEISELGSKLGKNALVYAGNFAGILGYSTGSSQTYVNDCFTAGMIRVDKEDLNGAIGGFIGAMFGTVKNSYTATTIISIADNNPVTVDCSDSDKKFASEDGIIGPMFGYSAAVLQTSSTTTAFYVFDYTGCVMRTCEADYARYGLQIAVSDIAKECIYGTTDPVMSVFASSTTGSWKTLCYAEYISTALYAYSLPILSFLESDTTLNSYCKFCETSTNNRLNILAKPLQGEESINTQAQEYQLYYGSKLYPYLLKYKDGYNLDQFRNCVEVQGVDVNNSYFALSTDFTLNITGNAIAFNNVNFHLLGYGNSITLTNGNYFAKKVESERLISSVNFVSNYGIINESDGIIYNIVVSGTQTFNNVKGYASSFITNNNGLVVNSGVIAKATIQNMDGTAKFGSFVGLNGAKGIINSCFSTSIVFISKDASKVNGSISGFVNTINESSHLLNIVSATSMNVIDDDKLEYKASLKAFVDTVVSSEVVIKRTFVDKLSIGYNGAYDFTVKRGNANAVKSMIYFVNTYYLVDSEDEMNTVSGSDDLKVLLGARYLEDDKLDLKYALAGRNYNYDYEMAYNYGYPFPAVISYFDGRAIKNAIETGNGTEGKPYQIPHAGKLDWMRSVLNVNETQAFDIIADLYMNVFESFNPIFGQNEDKYNIRVEDDFIRDTFNYYANLVYPGSGQTAFILNGLVGENQYIIYYLQEDIETDAGLFSSLRAGHSIKNVAITYANITTTSPRAGVLAGTIKGDSTKGDVALNNVAVFNSIITIPDSAVNCYVGGLAGTIEEMGEVRKCSAEVKINMPASTSTMNVGGLAGQAKNVKKFTNCYSGSNINILDGAQKIDKTHIGGIVGYNFVEGEKFKTQFINCISLASVNYSGLVGYRYNLTNYNKGVFEKSDLDDKEKITAFANIGNIVGASHIDENTNKPAGITITGSKYAQDITMISRKYAVGNNFGVDYTGLTEDPYSTCVSAVKTSNYAYIGAREGSKIKPFEIDGPTAFEKFGATEQENPLTNFMLFGMFTKAQTSSDKGVNLNGKFLYGQEFEITVNANMLGKVENSILSKIIVKGTATGQIGGSSGLLAHKATNTLINECTSKGTVNSSADYVGGLIGEGSATLILKCTSSATLSATQTGARVGGLAGSIERGGYWYCTTKNVDLTASGTKSYVGGIAGFVEETNTFVIKCDVLSGTITNDGDSGRAGGLIGHLDGLLVGGKLGTDSRVQLSGHFVGGVVGTCKEDTTSIDLSGFTANIDITNGTYAGGIASYFKGGYVIKNSTVNGTVKGKTAGGIAGYIVGATIGGETSATSDTNRINAEITSSLNDNNHGIGGVVGKSTKGIIQNNTVNGKVKGNNNAGGVAGLMVSTTVTANTVKKEVSGKNNVGGIAGYIFQPNEADNITGASEISGTNKVESSVTGAKNVGGIAGLVDQVNTSITGNTNSSTVSGEDCVGGLVGKAELPGNKNTGTPLILTNNRKTSGAVSASNGSAGGAIGYAQAVSSENNTASVDVTGKNAGGFVGIATKEKQSTFKNDTVSGSKTITGTDAAGGFIGVEDAKSTLEDVNVTVNKVTSTGGSGGLVGKAKGTNVKSWKLSFTEINGDHAGGFVGTGDSVIFGTQDINMGGTIRGRDAGGYAGNIQNTSLTGKEDDIIYVKGFTVQGTGGTSSGSIGSIFGYANNCSSINYIYSSVKVKGGTDNAGGIVGYLNGGSMNHNEYDNTIDGKSNCVGGIAGIANAANSGMIQNCVYKGGNISANNHAGGIAGYSENYTFTKNSATYSNGYSVSATNGSAGGVVGTASNGSITGDNNSINVTNVTASTGSAGGVVGTVNGVNVSGIKLPKLVKVSASGNSGGAVGYSNSSVSNISLNSGFSVSGENAGGIVGNLEGGNINNISFHASEIKGGTSVGGIVGYMHGSSSISSVTVSDGITVKSGTYCGGAVGKAENGTIGSTLGGKINISDATYAGGNVGHATSCGSLSSPNSINVGIGSLRGGSSAGGVAGYANNCSVNGVTISGSVNGTKHTGGIVGEGVTLSLSGCTVSAGVSGSGTSLGRYVGQLSGGNVNVNNLPSSFGTFGGATNSGLAVGLVSSGSVSVNFSSESLSGSFTSVTNAGPFVGQNNGSVSVTTSSLLKINIASGYGTIGGFVGKNNNSLTISGAQNIGAQNNAGGTVGGICGENNGTISGSFSLYYNVPSGKGVFGGGGGSLPSDIKIYVHKYGGHSNNSALSYANAKKNKGNAKDFANGTNWGTGVYPGDSSIQFNAQKNVLDKISVLNDNCLGYGGVSIGNAVSKCGNAPCYLQSTSHQNVYLQVNLQAGPGKKYFLGELDMDGWGDGMSIDSVAKYYCEKLGNRDIDSSEYTDYLYGSTAGQFMWYAGFASEDADDRYNGWQSMNTTDILKAVKGMTGKDISAASDYPTLKSNIKKKLSSYGLSEEGAKKFAYYWKVSHTTWDNALLSSDSTLELNIYDSLTRQLYASKDTGMTEEGFKKLMEKLQTNYEDHQRQKDSLIMYSDSNANQGWTLFDIDVVAVWHDTGAYDKSLYSYGTLENMYKAKNITSTSTTPSMYDLGSIDVHYKGWYDGFLNDHDFYINGSIPIKVEYAYGVDITPKGSPAAPSGMSFNGTAEYKN